MLLSEKLRSEAQAATDAIIARSLSGLPNHISVSSLVDGRYLWSGHRDLIPAHLRGARDPMHLLAKPASD